MRSFLILVAVGACTLLPAPVPAPDSPEPAPHFRPRSPGPVSPADPADARPVTAATDSSPSPAQPEPEPDPPGCWEQTYGSAPATSGRTFAGVVADCPGCNQLRAGPVAADLHVDVIRRLRAIETSLPDPTVDEPRLWVNSGRRDGPPNRSMHNQGLAVDLVICGLNTIQTAQHLRDAGFTCVIEYFDGDGNPCAMAHGDMRGQKPAWGAYGAGGPKALTCPKRAVSKGESCQNQAKAQWNYAGSQE